MAIYERNGKWYIDYYYKGRRIRECVGTSKVLAKQALQARKGEITQGRFRLQEEKEDIPFKEFVEEYLAYVKSYKKSYRRDEIYVDHFRRFFGKYLISEISPLLIERYKQKRLKEVKPATVNRELSSLRHIFNMAIKWGRLKTNPIGNVKFLKEEKLPLRVLSENEMNRLLEECSPWLRSIVFTALNTGMRMGEILGLEWRHVDLDLGIITVERSKSKEFRNIPLNEGMMELLRTLPRKSSYVFPNEEGKMFNNIHKGFYAAVRRAGLPHTRFHDLRHTFASQLVMNGVDLVTVKELLGHREITTTMRYAHLNVQHKQKAVEKLPRIRAKIPKKMAKYGHYMDTKMGLVKRVGS